MIFSRLLLLSVALFAAPATVVAAAGTIYPDDHWSFSTKLTTSNYADSIQSEIDNGKTVFVRFIASEVRLVECIVLFCLSRVFFSLTLRHVMRGSARLGLAGCVCAAR